MVFGHAKHSKLAGKFRSTDLTVWKAYVGYLEMYGLRFDGVLGVTAMAPEAGSTCFRGTSAHGGGGGWACARGGDECGACMVLAAHTWLWY